ncbi:MAG: HNH endonuclease [Propionibacteriaceae bacterium]|jgi:5-methylcytosine-specific restriction endonuclease McrA|nr:HNH endonuclease [Propionibacteriaceae bacterium]
MGQVLILNAGGEQVLGTVTLRHAIGMLYRQVARVHEAVPGASFGPYPLPRSVELVRYLYTRWVYEATGRPPYSREGVLRRDQRRCAYCGAEASTIDHVVPRSKGGKTSWTNCVAACWPCNNRKADKTPAQAGLRLRVEPRVPSLREIGVRLR